MEKKYNEYLHEVFDSMIWFLVANEYMMFDVFNQGKFSKNYMLYNNSNKWLMGSSILNAEIRNLYKTFLKKGVMFKCPDDWDKIVVYDTKVKDLIVPNQRSIYMEMPTWDLLKLIEAENIPFKLTMTSFPAAIRQTSYLPKNSCQHIAGKAFDVIPNDDTPILKVGEMILKVAQDNNLRTKIVVFNSFIHILVLRRNDNRAYLLDRTKKNYITKCCKSPVSPNVRWDRLK